jgi:hypothetical protein
MWRQRRCSDGCSHGSVKRNARIEFNTGIQHNAGFGCHTGIKHHTRFGCHTGIKP